MNHGPGTSQVAAELDGLLTSQLAVFVTMTPKPGLLAEVVTIIQGAFGRIRANETACIQLAAHVTDSGKILLYELWSDPVAFQEFVDRPDTVDYLGDLDRRLASRDAVKSLRATV